LSFQLFDLIFFLLWGPSWSKGKTSQSTMPTYLDMTTFNVHQVEEKSPPKKNYTTLRVCVCVCRSCFSVLTKKIPQNKKTTPKLVFKSWRANRRVVFLFSTFLSLWFVCHCLVFHISIRFLSVSHSEPNFFCFLFFHICIWCWGADWKNQKADDFLEDILNLEAGLEEADRNRVMDTTSEHHHQHQTLAPEVKIQFQWKQVEPLIRVNYTVNLLFFYFSIFLSPFDWISNV
jgi:hypothetical protein